MGENCPKGTGKSLQFFRLRAAQMMSEWNLEEQELSIYLCLCIYLERECVLVEGRSGKGQRERERESPASSALSAQSPMQGSTPRTANHDLSRNQKSSRTLNPLSHPGDPELFIFAEK